MADFVLGVLAILAGLVFCFSGHLWLRIALPVWGAFVGFAFGAGLVAGLGGDRFQFVAGVNGGVGHLGCLVTQAACDGDADGEDTGDQGCGRPAGEEPVPGAS